MGSAEECHQGDAAQPLFYQKLKASNSCTKNSYMRPFVVCQQFASSIHSYYMSNTFQNAPLANLADKSQVKDDNEAYCWRFVLIYNRLNILLLTLVCYTRVGTINLLLIVYFSWRHIYLNWWRFITNAGNIGLWIIIVLFVVLLCDTKVEIENVESPRTS